MDDTTEGIADHTGSGAWEIWSWGIWREIGTFHEWWHQILKGEIPTCTTTITNRQFDIEFAKLKQHKFADGMTHPKEIAALRKALHVWKSHRQSVLEQIEDSQLAQIYNQQTRQLCRKLFIMTKNRFEESGTMSYDYAQKVFANDSMSDNELFQHDYEHRDSTWLND